MIATPEQVKEMLTPSEDQIQEYQKQHLKLYRSRARLSSMERALGRAIELEMHFRQTGEPDRLAEALAMQGRFTEAANTAVSEELKQTFTNRAEAMIAEPCFCDAVDEHDQPNRYAESNTFIDGKATVIIRCKNCGKRFVDR